MAEKLYDGVSAPTEAEIKAILRPEGLWVGFYYHPKFLGHEGYWALFSCENGVWKYVGKCRKEHSRQIEALRRYLQFEQSCFLFGGAAIIESWQRKDFVGAPGERRGMVVRT